MIINYNVSGSNRKQLVAAIAEHTGEKAKYLGAPGFAYQIGGFTVSVDGKVTIEDNNTAAPLIHFLHEKGFQPEEPLADCIEDDADGIGTERTCASAFPCLAALSRQQPGKPQGTHRSQGQSHQKGSGCG